MNFQNLPKLILMKIFKDLSFKSIFRMSILSKRFKMLVFEESLWKFILIEKGFSNFEQKNLKDFLNKRKKENYLSFAKELASKETKFISSFHSLHYSPYNIPILKVVFVGSFRTGKSSILSVTNQFFKNMKN